MRTILLGVCLVTSLSLAEDNGARADLVSATAELRGMKTTVEEQVGRIKAAQNSGVPSYPDARSAYESTAGSFNTVLDAIAFIAQHPSNGAKRLAFDALVHLSASTSEASGALFGTGQAKSPRSAPIAAAGAAISVAPLMHLLNAALELGNKDPGVRALQELTKDLLWTSWDKVPYYDKSLQRRND